MKRKNLLFVFAVAMFALVFQACNKKSPADAGSILATVPSDVSMVTVINAENLSNDGLIDLADTGIDPTVLVLFREGYYNYLTGVAADPESFKKYYAAKTGAQFVATDGIQTSGNIALSDNRFWINLDRSDIDLNEIKHFVTISKSQSFLQNGASEAMVSFTDDAVCWGNISGLLNTTNLDFQKRAVAQVVVQTLFEDPDAVTARFNVEKDKVSVKANVLNSKGNLAKYLLPTEKLDITSISSIGGTADALLAIAVPKKLVEKLESETKSKSISVLGVYLSQLGALDGTVAIASSGDNLKGVVTTTGKNISTLSSFLSTFGLTSVIDGNLLKVSKGEVTGKGDVAQMALEFKGAVAGIDMVAPEVMSMMIFNDGNSLRFEVRKSIDAKDKAQLSSMVGGVAASGNQQAEENAGD